MAEQKLKCKDCGDDFTLTDEDQTFFKKKGYDLPVRCKPCRRIKKEQRMNQMN